MSGSRQKQLRRQKNITKNEALDRKIRIRQLMESPVIRSNDVVEYLLSRFVGKTGYHYISVSRYGSLFIHENYKALVPIVLHREFPISTSLGRFTDPKQKDCVISLVRVDSTFKGFVVGRDGQFYAGGVKEPISPAAQIAYLSNLGRVSAAEYNGAVQSQEAEYAKRLEEFTKHMQENIKKLDELDNDSHATPYDAIDITPDPYETETPL